MIPRCGRTGSRSARCCAGWPNAATRSPPCSAPASRCRRSASRPLARGVDQRFSAALPGHTKRAVLAGQERLGIQVVERNERAGQPATQDDLVDVPRLVTAYYAEHPDPADPAQRVAFGTSGHRGSALRLSFNDDHIAAATQAICDYRRGAGITGPLYIGRDTHALSEPAFVTALEVLAANDVAVLADSRDGYTPTPAVSLAILAFNEGR